MSKRKKLDSIPEPLESEIQAQCMQALTMLGLVPERQNTGAAAYDNKDGSKRYVDYGTPGAADIRVPALPDGRTLELEIKRPGKKPTDEQLARIRNINKNGGVAFWVYDPEQVIRVMPLILKGAWIEEDDDGNFYVTDERTTNA